MGQTIISDQTRSMVLSPPPSNVQQHKSYSQLLTYKCLQVPFFHKLFEYENYKKIEVTYKFFGNVVVHLEINKERPKVEAGCPLNIGNQVVYGYKFKKNNQYDRIRPDKIYFRRKIFSSFFQPPNPRSIRRDKMKSGLKSRSRAKESVTSKQTAKSSNKIQPHSAKEELIRKLAELKLLSKLLVGSKMARIIDGADGILTQNYIQFYCEVPIQKGEFQKRQPIQKQKLCSSLKKKGFKVNSDKIQMAYSVFQRKYILKQSKQLKKEQQIMRQNRGIKYMVRACEQQINFIVDKLDGTSNMLCAIQNHLNYRQIDRAMQKFQENMAELQDMERIQYAQKMVLMLSKYKYYRFYENQVTSFISQSRSSCLSQSKNISSSRFSRRFKSQDSSNDSIGSSLTSFKSSRLSPDYDSRIPISPHTASPSKTTNSFRMSQQISKHLYTPEKDSSSHDSLYFRQSGAKESPYFMWESALERLKNSINDNDKISINQSLICLKNLTVLNQLQTQTLYGRLLMQNGKTKFAKKIFQKLIYSKKTCQDSFVCSQIECMIGFIYQSRGQQSLALNHYEKALSELLKLRNYSRKTTIIFNNMAVLEFHLQNYEKSLLWLHRGFKLGEYCADYELLMRSNNAMILAQKGQIKQAKMQMYKMHKSVEPICNMQILCKFHSNSGYLQLLQNVLEKAKSSFQLAWEIQNKYLIPTGYKPSVFLHNNFAIYHTKVSGRQKRAEWKKAASHLFKIQSQLSQIQGFTAVQIHFNFGKILKQNYKPDQAIKHFQKCESLLSKLKQIYITRYKQKILLQIQKILQNQIFEQSEQSSYANKWSKMSKRSHISIKQLQSKILN